MFCARKSLKNNVAGSNVVNGVFWIPLQKNKLDPGTEGTLKVLIHTDDVKICIVLVPKIPTML